jgi:hypothetical protein
VVAAAAAGVGAINALVVDGIATVLLLMLLLLLLLLLLIAATAGRAPHGTQPLQGRPTPLLLQGRSAAASSAPRAAAAAAAATAAAWLWLLFNNILASVWEIMHLSSFHQGCFLPALPAA